jgi:hypothetical protein
VGDPVWVCVASGDGEPDVGLAPRVRVSGVTQLLVRSLLVLRWCDEHESDCLGDHPAVMARLRGLLVEIEDYLREEGL